MASSLAFKCEVCISSVDEKEIYNHKCVKDWYKVTINSQSKTFYPTNDKGEYLAKIVCNGKEQVLLLKDMSNYPSSSKKVRVNKVVMQSNPFTDECCSSENISQNLTFNPDKVDSTALEELLIEEVRKRSPIYDYTLPLSIRSRQKIVNLWKEISESLNGLMSPEDAKKRWKTLKDTFNKMIVEEKKPSGSAGSSKKPWKHLESMSFLRSVSTNKNSISNIMTTMNVLNNNMFEESNSEEQINIAEYKSNEDQSSVKRRVKSRDDVTASMNRIADALCTKEMPVINLLKPSEIGALNGMFLYIKERLQKLSSEKQDKLLLKFLHNITKEEHNRRE